VAFRDDREAVLARIDAVESEIADIDAAIERIEAERERHWADIRSGARVGRKVFWVPLAAGVVAAVAFFALESGKPGGSRETLYGTVRDATGGSPVSADTRCAIFFEVEDSDSDRIGVDVLCGGRVVYGGRSQGFLTCDDFDGSPRSCDDGEPTSEDGDPKLRFDRARGRVEVLDETPQWQLVIDLGPWARPYGSDDE
jgi:hypothetical protein